MTQAMRPKPPNMPHSCHQLAKGNALVAPLHHATPQGLSSAVWHNGEWDKSGGVDSQSRFKQS